MLLADVLFPEKAEMPKISLSAKLIMNPQFKYWYWHQFQIICIASYWCTYHDVDESDC